MSVQTPPSAPQGDTTNPKAAAKAAKAYAKAMRPWYKKKRFMIPLVLVVLAVLASMFGGGSDDSGPTKVAGTGAAAAATDAKAADTSDAKAGSEDNPIEVGETVELEGTQYKVKSAKTRSSVGDSFLQEEAAGRYVVVRLSIENTKDETKIFSDSAVKFVTAGGKSYSTDSDATVAMLGDSEPLLFEEMQPDLAKTGSLVFDVPASAIKGGVLEVSDLFGRGEAYIDLGLKK